MIQKSWRRPKLKSMNGKQTYRFVLISAVIAYKLRVSSVFFFWFLWIMNTIKRKITFFWCFAFLHGGQQIHWTILKCVRNVPLVSKCVYVMDWRLFRSISHFIDGEWKNDVFWVIINFHKYYSFGGVNIVSRLLIVFK